ncbi:UNVERIFIED_CONTAM: zinc finger protein 84 [Trichonephila clavipes]
MSILKGELLATNFGSTSDNSCENAELSNNLLQHDFSVERLKSSWSCIHSNTCNEDCNFQTQSKSNFETTYHCDTCLNKFHSKDTLLKQKCIFSRDKPFQYELYKRNFSPSEHISQIKSEHSSENYVQCVICKQTLLQTDFEWHMLTHTASPNQGDISKQKISETEHFTRLMCTNIEEKIYQCIICKREFSLKRYLALHMRTHTGEKPFQCHVCKKKNSRKEHLTRHIRTHTKEKPYQCHVCKTKFSRKVSLTRHIRTHTKEKPYQCHVCKTKFSQKTHLIEHIRTHTGENPYECHLCGHIFPHRTTLNNYIRTHNGERFFKCHLYQQKFSR